MMRTASIALVLLIATLPVVAMSQTSKPPGERTLLVIGASYAADWGEPRVMSGYRTVNKGVGGQTSAQVRARFEQDALAARPDAVLIWGHINDIFRAPAEQRAKAEEVAQANYRAMAAQARNAGVQVILATEVTLTVGDSWLDRLRGFIGSLRGRENYRVVINGHVKNVNEWLRTYAAEQDIPLLDLERAVDSGTGSRAAEYSMPDGSHISPAGYAAITAYAVKTLKR